MKRAGLTLIELLIVIAILAILILLGWFSFRRQIDKANDAKRKDQLSKLAVAFEDYYSDFDCYPDETILDNCGGGELDPYLDSIPCDPTTGQAYCYVPDGTACSNNFRILVPLDNDSDPDIAKLGCDGDQNCGWDDACGSLGYNYGVASTNVAVLNPALPSPSPSPSAGPSEPPASLPPPGPNGNFACDPTGVCNSYSDPEGSGCPITFSDSDLCQQYCDASPAYWCES
ncbi:MAG: Type II secretion system protein G [Candidatus Beckwithbacteria bacterium GW2011_GWB1_47_15]|uniref:Type II secretion system protein G n=1 Tax=Candidatus Beckwithbacteria bacterium GW2011_GWB1_47_15 TaxID=1618371 RepID=A0A0G1RVG8_9BACT|nr:MAG: type II secretion system protein G, general secretion pathway protein G [Candidatus Beckwithbacteria bacterium GW2011_GWC1_49_16]KKU35437.1 MAG: Type II secretion system protein G [Candidatus Beckwithbacteria bacterium GW2011_GWA1_46_30]KKU61112.1 MAG: Type II secretion system protein G [Candidatus Beckwithbacteria bacterium GW2011_GWB1_47_15]KKU71951.1 MAG: Type II secretion system protein G [Candidatus Beckwithbacteria bacterium GW2011_GWA2_47_25]KKW03188.1 MAG: Type II secretion syst